MQTRTLSRLVWLVPVVVMGSIAGCPGTSNDNGSPVPGVVDLTGYWMSAEDGVRGTASNRVDVDYWYFVAQAGSPQTYSVYHACNQDIPVATATVAADENVMIVHHESGAVLNCRLIDDHLLDGLDLVDEANWSAWRVEQPQCETDGDTGQQRVAAQALNVVLEEDEIGASAAPAKFDEAQTIRHNGVDHLAAAATSRLTVTEESRKATTASQTSCTSNGTTTACPTGSGGHPGYVECTTQGWSESQNERLAEVVCLMDTDQVYPGALLQGAYFDGGSFVPVTIPRSGGSLTLSGLAFAGSRNYTRTLGTIDYATVQEAIANILTSSEIKGTAANASCRIDESYSASQWAFELGTDVNVMSVDIKASAESGSDKEENTVIMKFTQVFYTVSFPDPTLRTDVFRDGDQFDDPEGQIGAGNPPLYVSNVKYGRQVFFFARSKLASSYVKAALDGAYNGAAKVSVHMNMSYQDIMSQTSISYIVRGGAAGLALEPIKAASPTEMYDKVKEFLANKDAAEFSASNPGVPVAYTMRYLQDRTVAIKGYNTTYDRSDCRTMASQAYQYELKVSDIDDDVYVWLDSETDATRKAYTNQRSMSAHVNNWLQDDNDHTLLIKLGNGGCFGTSGNFSLYRDGVRVWHLPYYPGGWSTCGWQVDARIVVNRNTGKVSQSYLWTK